jgi:hypothetical protein
MADTTQFILPFLSLLCILPFILLLLLLYILFIRPSGGGMRYLLYGHLDNTYAAGFNSYGNVEFHDDSVLLEPPGADSITVPKKDIVSAVEESGLLGMTKLVYVFYRSKGLLSVFIVSRSLFGGASFEDKLPGVPYHKKGLLRSAMKQYQYLLEKKDKSAMEGEPLMSEGMGGALILADPDWPRKKLRKGGEPNMLFLPIIGSGIGIDIYKDAILLTNPIYPDIQILKKDILSIEPLGKSFAYKSMTIRHKAENLPERIDYARRNLDNVLAKLKEAGYPVGKPKKLQ